MQVTRPDPQQLPPIQLKDTSQPSTFFHTLPSNEIVELIFKRLNAVSLTKIYQVCRRFKYLIDKEILKIPHFQRLLKQENLQDTHVTDAVPSFPPIINLDARFLVCHPNSLTAYSKPIYLAPRTPIGTVPCSGMLLNTKGQYAIFQEDIMVQGEQNEERRITLQIVDMLNLKSVRVDPAVAIDKIAGLSEEERAELIGKKIVRFATNTSSTGFFTVHEGLFVAEWDIAEWDTNKVECKRAVMLDLGSVIADSEPTLQTGFHLQDYFVAHVTCKDRAERICLFELSTFTPYAPWVSPLKYPITVSVNNDCLCMKHQDDQLHSRIDFYRLQDKQLVPVTQTRQYLDGRYIFSPGSENCDGVVVLDVHSSVAAFCSKTGERLWKQDQLPVWNQVLVERGLQFNFDPQLWNLNIFTIAPRRYVTTLSLSSVLPELFNARLDNDHRAGRIKIVGIAFTSDKEVQIDYLYMWHQGPQFLCSSVVISEEKLFIPSRDPNAPAPIEEEHPEVNEEMDQEDPVVNDDAMDAIQEEEAPPPQEDVDMEGFPDFPDFPDVPPESPVPPSEELPEIPEAEPPQPPPRPPKSTWESTQEVLWSCFEAVFRFFRYLWNCCRGQT